jgi:hypothetical protein
VGQNYLISWEEDANMVAALPTLRLQGWPAWRQGKLAGKTWRRMTCSINYADITAKGG